MGPVQDDDAPGAGPGPRFGSAAEPSARETGRPRGITAAAARFAPALVAVPRHGFLTGRHRNGTTRATRTEVMRGCALSRPPGAAARRASCQSNLRQFGVALLNHHAVRRTFPPGAAATFPSDNPLEAVITATANSLLLPYFEEMAIAAEYEHDKLFVFQPQHLFRAEVPTFVCPTNGHQMLIHSVFSDMGFPVGDTFATTDYAYSHGATDAWCLSNEYPPREKGPFDVGSGTKLRKITDGTSHTLAMGEAAGGDAWPLCYGRGCMEPGENADCKRADAEKHEIKTAGRD